MCSVNPLAKSFPIVLIPSSIGNCSDTILNILKNTKNNLINNYGINIIGMSFDGDSKYFELLNPIYKKIIEIEKYNFDKPIDIGIFFSPHEFLFSDPLHLMKYIRYRLVKNIPIYYFLSCQEATINIDSFISIGIPNYLLDSHHSRKMEDNLPLELFSFKYLKLSMDLKRMDIYFALYPFFY